MTKATEVFGRFEDNSSVIYALDSTLNIAYCNAAWDEFALRNGGATLTRNQPMGMNALDVTPTPLLPFYTSLFQSVLREGKERDCLYECSSDEIFRRFHMHVARMQIPGRGQFLVVLNSLVLETLHEPSTIRYDVRTLRGENGLITMCAHCRRVRLPKVNEQWVWVPDLVRSMPAEVSHGICPVCFDIHYSGH